MAKIVRNLTEEEYEAAASLHGTVTEFVNRIKANGYRFTFFGPNDYKTTKSNGCYGYLSFEFAGLLDELLRREYKTMVKELGPKVRIGAKQPISRALTLYFMVPYTKA